MCFYHHYDWYASVYEETPNATKDTNTRCDECWREIPAGTPHTHIFMQEHDAPVVDDDDDQPPDDYDPGNTDDYVRCRDCDDLLKAVQASEEEAGCKGDSTRPALTRLKDAMQDDDGDRYLVKAREMFPHLTPEYLALMAGTEGDD